MNTATKYLVDDIKGAVTPHALFAHILGQLESSGKLYNTHLEYLAHKGFDALHQLGTQRITFADYLPLAEEEQRKRRVAAEEESRRHQAEAEAREWERQTREHLAREQYEVEQRAQINSPRYQAKIRDTKLREKYGLNEFIEREDYPKLMVLLCKLDKGLRVSPEDYTWLVTKGGNNYERYLTPELEKRYHHIEAKCLAAEFKQTGDPWHAVNASKHFRKCGHPEPAEQLLYGINILQFNEAKLKSALCTTYGGVKRDLRKFDEAIKLGNLAHRETPHDFRPCTLLGAVHYEQGDCEQGRKWYDKAVERGFKETEVDRDLKSIFRQLDPDKRATMRAHLLQLNPERYEWAQLRNQQQQRAKANSF